MTQSARSFDTDLVSEVLTYRRSKKETAYAAVINRLDRPVGGLVLFAKTKQAAARLSKEMQQNTLNKQYYALICGNRSSQRERLWIICKRCESESVQSCFKGKQRSKAGRVRI